MAQGVLSGATKGYRHHLQLARFRASARPEAAIASFLADVLEEAKRRRYSFDAKKIPRARLSGSMKETRGQLLFE